jgi:hypothetical protein
MCLSTVYLDRRKPENVLVEEAAGIARDPDGTILIETLLGERRSFPGHTIAEVNLLDHYVILTQTGEAHGPQP